MSCRRALPLCRVWAPVLLCAVSLVCTGCPDLDGDEGDREELPAVVPSAEQMRMEKELLAGVESQMNRVCRRPVLRGAPLEGPGGGDIMAVLGSAHNMRDCHQTMLENKAGISSAFWFPRGFRLPGAPARLWHPARPVGDPALDSDAMRAMAQGCAPMAERVARAVSHEDACSPYRPGLRGQPSMAEFKSTLQAIQGLTRHRVETGDLSAGVDLLLDGVRLGQDLKRGGASFMLALMGSKLMDVQLQTLELVLNRTERLDPKLLISIERQLGALIDSEPHPASIMDGEPTATALYLLLPIAKPSDWQPPGGFGPLGRLRPRHRFDPSKDRAVFQEACLLAVERMRRDWTRACTFEMTGAQCQQNLAAWREPLLERNAMNDEAKLSRLQESLDYGGKEAYTRMASIMFMEVAAPASRGILEKNGRAGFTLAALRLHAAYRRLAQKRRRCPGIGAFDREPLLSLRTDPYSGKPIRVVPGGGGIKFVLRSPASLRSSKDKAEPAVFIECPGFKSRAKVRKRKRGRQR